MSLPPQPQIIKTLTQTGKPLHYEHGNHRESERSELAQNWACHQKEWDRCVPTAEGSQDRDAGELELPLTAHLHFQRCFQRLLRATFT